jgi:TPR repeat protein
VQAIQWWKKAAEIDHAKAQVKLGLAYAHGKGVEKSAEQAFHWYTKAAEQGDASAQFYCGLALQLGEGVAQDSVLARERYEQAAAHDIVQACFNLGGTHSRLCCAAGNTHPSEISSSSSDV